MKTIINGTRTIYNIFDASGALIHTRDNGVQTDYIRAGGMTVARQVLGGTVTYVHPDHLGSAETGTDSVGGIAWRETHTPFGEVINPAAANDNEAAYTGHIRDSATGLNYMQARYQDPVIGRFLSIDPVGFTPDQPFMFNRYAYVGNDPVNNWDPDGECFVKKKIVSAARPGCRIIGSSSARVDPRFSSSKMQIRTSLGLIRNSLFGGGAAAQFDISRRPRSISGAESRIFASAAGQDAGSFSLAISAAIQSGELQRISTVLGGLQTGLVGVGQANFTLNGTLTVSGDVWSFSGTITGTGEEFDMNAKPFGERALGSESLTRAGAAIGASEFKVDYLGSFAVKAVGKIQKKSCTGTRIKKFSC